MDKVRLAVVGCGTISVMNVPGYLMHAKCEVRALCDPVRERAEDKARRWGITPKIYTKYEDVMNDPEIDAVELLTPTPVHAQQIVDGLEAGKHVSCQKPICNTLTELDRIAGAVAKAKTKFRVTENLLAFPPLTKAKELLDSGAIGDPSLLRIRVLRGRGTTGNAITIEPDSRAWRRDPKANTGGYLFDGAWHMYAVAMAWLGVPEKVYGMLTTTDDFWEELPSTVLWKFKGRDCQAVFQFLLAQNMPMRNDYVASDEFYELQGSEGLLWVTARNGFVDMPSLVLHRGTETTGIDTPTDWKEGFNGAAGHFIDCILDDEQPTMDIDFARRVLETTLAVYRSAEADSAIDPGLS